VTGTATSSEILDLYRGAKGRPRLVEVPELWFLMVDGTGPPGGAECQEAEAALNAVDSALRLAIQSRGRDVEITPLEACWSVVNPHRAPVGIERGLLDLEKASWSWTAMIRQSEPVAEHLVDEAVRGARAKAGIPAIERLRFAPLHEGLAVQIVHPGPYDAEPTSLEVLHRYLADHDYRPAGRHHEIYLNNAEHCAPDRLRTILRQPVAGPG